MNRQLALVVSSSQLWTDLKLGESFGEVLLRLVSICGSFLDRDTLGVRVGPGFGEGTGLDAVRVLGTPFRFVSAGSCASFDKSKRVSG